MKPVKTPSKLRLRDLRQVRLLAHPLRLRLLEQFAMGARTTKQAAEALGEPLTRLYHHVHALEHAGLLVVRDSRHIRGTIEKRYEAAAQLFEVDDALIRGDLAPAIAAAVVDAGAQTMARLTHHGRAGARLLAARLLVPGDPRELERLYTELMAVAQRARGSGDLDSTGVAPWALTITLTPSAAVAKPRRATGTTGATGATAGSSRTDGKRRRGAARRAT